MIYPVLNQYVTISEESGIAIDSVSGKNVDLPIGAFPLLKLIDGKTSIDEIKDKIVKTYKVSPKAINNFITNMSELGFVSLLTAPNQMVIDKKPAVRLASIELTERCNLSCRYCYGAFSPENKRNLSFKDSKTLFNALKNRNVNNVELTGGEPTVNPQFDEILNEACELFPRVTVMTNAVILRQSSMNIYKKYCNKIGFSISIDGFSDKTNNFQRGVINTFSHTLNNIIRIKDEINPHYLRVVYMLTNENVHEVDAFIEFMLSHEIRELMISIPENVEKGRTYKLSDGCMMSDRLSISRNILDEKVTEIGEKYGKEIETVAKRLGSKGMQIANTIPSCGAGWTMLSFQVSGNVQPCNMMDKEWVLGNYKQNPNLEFLSYDNPLYAAFASINLSSDGHNRDECKGCSFENFCGKCINKILMANRTRTLHGESLCPIFCRTKLPKDILLNH